MKDMRIYVASLSDYNNGRLEGKWLDLTDYSDASELMEAIQEMLDALTEKYKSIDGEVREEWAVHDYEGIPSTLASEYMSEQDFQQLYDIAEVADDRGIPVEVLVERAGDTGSDDYQSLADSLMFVVDGYDESDIVAEYESQIGDLGSDFWSNHIYIDDVTERVMYGEDVDRFREDILYENPDLDEDEAEGQAEAMADEEAERREDLTTYLEDMGYGDSIPDFVSKDYEGAWKRSLSYDFDVINHDGEMYVFSNNYSLGGTILSGMIGAYIGYKIGRSKPQKKGFETEKKIGRQIKGALTKKKMARGGGVSERISKAKLKAKLYKPTGDFFLEDKGDKWYIHFTPKDASKNSSNLSDLNATSVGNGYYGSAYSVDKVIKHKYAQGGNINTGRSWHQDRRMHNKSERYEKPMNSRKRQFADGGNIFKGSRGKNQKVQNWYIKNYPTDDLGQELNDQITFDGLWRMMNQRYDFYDLIDVADSLVRERIFSQIAKIYEIDYDLVYNTWLKGFRYAEGGRVEKDSNYYEIIRKIEINERMLKNTYGSERVEKVQQEIQRLKDELKNKYGHKYAQGGGVDGKMTDEERKEYEKGQYIHYNIMNGRWQVWNGNESVDFMNQEQAEKFAGFEYDQDKDVRYSRNTYQYLSNGGGVDSKMNFYVAEGTIYWSDESGEYQRFFTRNHIKAESKEKAKMIFIRYIENQTRTNEWDWAEDDIFIEPATDSDEVIEFRGYLSEKDYGGLSKDKFSIDRFSKGGGVDYPNHYLEVEELNQKINALTQQIESDYRNNEIDSYTDRYERELDKLKQKRDFLMYGKDSYSQGGGVDEEKIWEIIYKDRGVQKSILVEGYSHILEENNWRNKNPTKEFIQIRLYGNKHSKGGGISGLDDLIRG